MTFVQARNEVRTSILTIVGMLVCTSALSQLPDAGPIIENYQKAQAWHESFEMQYAIQSKSASLFGGKELHTNLLLRKDSTKQGRILGESTLVDDSGRVTGLRGSDKPDRIQQVFRAGEEANTYYREIYNDPPRAQVNSASKKDFLSSLDFDCGAALFGRYSSFSSSSLADLLSQPGVTVREESLGDRKCMVLERQAEEGTVSAWISPELDYNVVQYKMEKVAGRDKAADGKPFPDPEIIDRLTILPVKWAFEMTDIEYQRVDGVLVPVRAKYTTHNENSDGKVDEIHSTISVSNIDVTPEFAADAFTFDIPNGTEVSQKLPDGRILRDLKWIDGQITVGYDNDAMESITQHVASVRNGKEDTTPGEDAGALAAQPDDSSAVPPKAGATKRQVLLASAGVVVLAAAIAIRIRQKRAR